MPYLVFSLLDSFITFKWRVVSTCCCPDLFVCLLYVFLIICFFLCLTFGNTYLHSSCLIFLMLSIVQPKST